MKTYLILAVVILALSSCKRRENVEAVSLVTPTKTIAVALPHENSMSKFAPPVTKPDGEAIGNADAKDYVAEDKSTNMVIKDTSKKIIKQGDITFEARDITPTRRTILNVLSKLGGYVDEDNESTDSEYGRKEYIIKARVPAKNFDVFLDSIASGAAKIDSKHISISDVTAQYIDMATRLQNQKILEGTYLKLLKRASKMSDVLEVEDKLTDTRTEIESEQGQLNYMNKQIAYSSLDITFYTKQIQHETGTGSGYKMRTALSTGWQTLQDLFFGIISLWPVILFITTMIIVVKRWRKRRRIFKQPI